MKLRIAYLVEKGKGGGPPYYWQPSGKMRSAGARPEQIGAAAARARELNIRHGVSSLEPRMPLKAAATRGTIKGLIIEYKRSTHFTKLAPATKRSYVQALDRIDQWMGDKRPALITPSLVHQLYGGLAKPAPVFAHHTDQGEPNAPATPRIAGTSEAPMRVWSTPSRAVSHASRLG